MHGAFSANLDRPARVRFVVIKAGKHQGCLPASFDFGCRGTVFLPPEGWRKRTSFRCTFRHGGRGTGACIPAAAPRKRTGFLFAPAHKNPARFPAGVNGARKQRTPLPPSAAPAGITHYTLQARWCAKGGNSPPLETPASGLRAWSRAYRPHQSINQSIISFSIWIDRSDKL